MEALRAAIQGWNPWWIQAWNFPPTVSREMTGRILALEKTTHIKDIIGIRRSGKSTVMMQVIESLVQAGSKTSSMILLNFEDPVLKNTTFTDIQDAIFFTCPDARCLFLDEIQEKNGWEHWVRTIYDTRRFEAIFISGSSASLLVADIGRVLSGRHLSFVLLPFSFQEYLRLCKWPEKSIVQIHGDLPRLNRHLEDFLLGGGFPEVLQHDEPARRRILTDLFKDIVSRDIVARHHVDATKVQALAIYVFTNWTRTFSYNKIASALNMHVNTIENYLGYMEEAFLIFVLNRFAYKLQKQYREEKKIYVIDTGLRFFIAFQTTKDMGKAAENAVFLELKRRDLEVYYWQDGNHEVDFCVTHGASVQDLIQVAWDITSPATKKREVEGLLAAAKALKQDHGTIITFNVASEEAIDSVRIRFVPLAAWLLDK
nr:ATP-binding protein [Candidatus Sigynarchaeum springense]